jgi:BASS family bile acid:Na+ symporter
MFWQFLSRNLALLTLAGAVATYFHPPLFLLFKDCFLWCFAATMFGLGVVLRPEEARDALSRPHQVGLGAIHKSVFVSAN